MLSEREIRDRGLKVSRSVFGQDKENEMCTPVKTPQPKIHIHNLMEKSDLGLLGLVKADSQPTENSAQNHEADIYMTEEMVTPSSTPMVVYITDDKTPEEKQYQLFEISASLSTPTSTLSNQITHPPTESIIYGFDIETVLKEDERSRAVIENKILKQKMVIRSDRQCIVNALIAAVIANLGTCPSKQALQQLAKHLVQKYPSLGDPTRPSLGSTMWFSFSEHRSAGPTGFLEERLKNQRREIAKKKRKEKLAHNPEDYVSLNWDSEHEKDDPEPEEKLMEFMRQNFGSQQIPQVMKETTFSRRTVIRQLIDSAIPGFVKITQVMPRLFDVQGMISQDFDTRHPNLAYVVYDRWPKASKVLFRYADESGIDYMTKLSVKKHRYDLTDSDYQIIAFALLPYILPSCGRKINSNVPDEESSSSDADDTLESQAKKRRVSKKKAPKTVKSSDLCSVNGLIVFKPKNTHVASVLEENHNPAPFILALGSTTDLNFEDFFVLINKIAIPCGSSFLVALDTCLKSFSVLYFPLPISSGNHWAFMQHCIGGKPVDKPLSPVVQALIGQISPRI